LGFLTIHPVLVRLEGLRTRRREVEVHVDAHAKRRLKPERRTLHRRVAQLQRVEHDGEAGVECAVHPSQVRRLGHGGALWLRREVGAVALEALHQS